MNINEKLDQQFPISCLICETPMRRAGQDWPICLKCGLDQTGAEAYAIQRYKPAVASNLSKVEATTATP